MASAESRSLLLPPLLEAINSWGAEPAEHRQALESALVDVAAALGLGLGRIRVDAPPLPELDLDLGAGTVGAEIALRAPGERRPIGSARISGDPEQAAELARALELGLSAARARSVAERATAQLTALDQAVRGIGGVLDVDRVLQLITDRVRGLVGAQYAAIGIVDADGEIERFITSGIDDEHRARIGELPHGRGLLGMIIRGDRTYRVPDITRHPERYGFPPNHPEMHSFLGMPIKARGEVVGRLYLTNKLDAAEFSEHDQSLVEMFALHAGIAIDNTRLHDQVQRLAIVDERERISRDLHDSAIQAIYAQTLALEDVPDLIAEDPDEVARRVDEAIDALHAVIRDIRNFIFGLRPVLMNGGSLADGLRDLATELRRGGGVDVEVVGVRRRDHRPADRDRRRAAGPDAGGAEQRRAPRRGVACLGAAGCRCRYDPPRAGGRWARLRCVSGCGTRAPRPGEHAFARGRARRGLRRRERGGRWDPYHRHVAAAWTPHQRRSSVTEPPVQRLRLLVVDDHEVVRQGLVALLDRRSGLEVVAQAGNVAEAVSQAARFEPDVVIMDVRLPDGSGIEACRDIRAARPDTRVVMLTSYPDEEAVLSAIIAGASGYLLKQVRGRDLVAAIEAVGRGDSLLDPAVTEKILQRVRMAASGEATDELADLTPQERKILLLVAEGMTNKEIAAEVFLSDKTVKNYVSSILSKLNLQRRTQAAAFVAKHHLGPPPEGS